MRSIVNDLRKPIHTLDVLKALLQSSLKTLQIQTSSGKKAHNGAQRFSVSAFSASEVRYILPLQDVIIQQIIPTWHHLLVEDGSNELVDLLFDPPSNSEHSSALVAVHAHTVLVSALHSSSDFAANLLERLVGDWPLDKIHLKLFSDRNEISDGQLESIWSDYLRAVFAVPAKVANATKNNAPERLTFRLALSPLPVFKSMH